MRQIELQEYRESEPQRLSVAERDTLKEVLPSLTIQAVPGESDLYKLRPEAVIGALELADLSIAVRPKLDISRVIYLASYAMGAYKPRKERFDFKSEPTLVESLALALTSAARRAFAQGAAERLSDRAGRAANCPCANRHGRTAQAKVRRARAGGS